jgi:hypothetical protein
MVRDPLFVLMLPFVAGVVASFIFYKLTKWLPASRLRLKRLSVYLFLVTLVSLAVWPILSAISLLSRGERLIAALPLLYAFPYVLGTTLLAVPLMRLVKLARTDGIDVARARVISFKERMVSTAPTAEELSDHRGIAWRQISNLLELLEGIFIGPTLLLKLVLGIRLGRRVSFWPDFDGPWFATCILFGYLIARPHPMLALVLSCYLYALKLNDVISRFDTRGGVLKMLSLKRFQVGLSSIVFAAAVIASSLGCVHYCLSLINPSAYSRPLTAIDGLYFSVITFATVGYGDIYPTADASKLLCVSEILSGCLVLVFGVNLVMTVWLQKVTRSVAPVTEPLPSAASASDQTEHSTAARQPAAPSTAARSSP